MKKLKGESYSDYLKRIAIKNETNKNIQISTEELNERKKSVKTAKNLAISFKFLTTNDDFNFHYFKKNKIDAKEFLTRFTQTLEKITKLTTKDMFNPIFRDRFAIKNLYEGVYQCPYGIKFEGFENIISVELASKKHERMILFHDNREETGENVLYVLCFQFSFNKKIYDHE